MRPCETDRPRTKDDERKKTERAFTLDQIADAPVSIVVIPGCVENINMSLSLRGEDRAVLAYGTVNQIVRYAIGQEVVLDGMTVPAEYKGRKFTRNPNRKHDLVVRHITDELNGTGQALEVARQRGGRPNGYKFIVNGEPLTSDSVLNTYFRRMVFVEGPDPQPGEERKPKIKPLADLGPRDKRIMRDGKPVEEFMGGVDLVVSAVIVPGSDRGYLGRQDRERQEYQ